MAEWTTLRFGNQQSMIERLNGALIGKLNLVNGADVDGLTLVYDVGAGNVTVTFVAAKGRPWTITEIVNHINATTAGLASIKNVSPTDRRLKLQSNTLDVDATGTGNTVLGFPAGGVTADPIPLSETSYAGPEPGEQSWIVTRYA